MKNSFCVLPWIHRFVNVDGKVGVCCTSEEFNNLVLSNDQTPFDTHHEFDEGKIQNSEFLKKVRKDMLSGKLPEFCFRCLQTEQSGSLSRRNIDNQKYQNLHGEILKNTSEDGSTNIKISSLDLRPGNICNLACRMCNPRSSTSWLKEWNSIKTQPFFLTEEMKREYMSYDWYKKPWILDYVIKNISYINHLHFAGGEPLILPEVLTLLEKIIELGFSKNIRLSFNTNLTVFNDRIKNLLPQYNGTQLLISLDGYKDINELIRYPSKWDILDNNLKYIDKNFTQLNINEAIIMTTLQVYNVFKLDDLYVYTSQFLNINQVPLLVDLYYPSYYCTQILTTPHKRMAEERLLNLYKNSKEKFPNNYNVDCLLGAIEFMKKEDNSKEYSRFLKTALEKDRLRSNDTFDLIPELMPFDAN